MSKKEIIKRLEKENDWLRYLNLEQEKKIEILEFKVEKGANPVEFINTGSVHIIFPNSKNEDKGYERNEEYQVKYITTIGDINVISLGFFEVPSFDIITNDENECIFSVGEKGKGLKWFKLFKGRRIVVDIPEPRFIIEDKEAQHDKSNRTEG